MKGLEALEHLRELISCDSVNNKIQTMELIDTIQKELKDYDSVKKSLKLKIDDGLIIFEYKGKKLFRRLSK